MHEKAELLEAVAAVRRDGYAWVGGEFAPRIAGLAVPVRDARHNVVASISVNLPSGEVSREKAVKRFLPPRAPLPGN